MSAGRVTATVAAGVPLALLAVLGAEVWLAARAEYLPGHPGYRVEATVTPRSATRDGSAVTLVVLGDSTVAGVGAPTADESLAVLVAQRVADDLGRPVRVTGLGVSGARVVDVPGEQAPRLVDGGADMVVVAVGSNDVTHVTPPWTFQGRTEAMLAAVSDRSGGAPVVLAGIPRFSGVHALAQPLRWVVDRYAAVLADRQRAAAAAAGAAFVPIAQEASPRFAGVPDAMSADAFHPGPVGYGFWADAIAPRVVRAVR